MKLSTHLHLTLDQLEKVPDLPGHPWKFILLALKRLKWWLPIILILQILSTICAVLIPYSLGTIISIITNRSHDVLQASVFWLPLILFTLVNIGEVAFGRLAGFMRVYVAPLQRSWVSSEMFAYLQHHSQRFLNQNFAGALASRISETAMSCNMITWAIVFDFFPVILTMAFSIGILYFVSWELSLFILLWSILFLFISYKLAKKSQFYSKKFAAARSETVGCMVDVVSNLALVKYFARSAFERHVLHRFLEKEVKSARKSFGYNEFLQLFQFSAAVLLKVGVLIIAIQLWLHHRINVGDLVMSITLAFTIIAEAKNISRRFLDIFEFIGNIENGVRSIIQPHDLVDHQQAYAIEVHQPTIEFKNVTFGYKDHQKIFDQFNLKIKAGEKVGLVGFSGSGKSTFINLIMRMYDVKSGAILIDNQDIKEVTLNSLHQVISYIPQDSSLFHRSLAENIRYGRLNATQAEIETVAKQACAHEFISQLDQGYSTIAGERGVNLSGGQRQRIAIARALINEAPILIMDEATASLDSLTESEIQKALIPLMEDRTCIVIAHRLSTVANLDRIIYLKDGQVIEDGSPQELLSNQHGAFKYLWDNQSKGMLAH
ncbi:hypothetical protein B9T31_02915 [Acinetobacter sp. ANC 4558]|uniref:ABC transporter ATP-binding protein n=1 Tax=Acinetobacter sp. ANC 4558 TaxID=1977876 RepID=UPI000A34C1F3|nr:ABC transporter ATP-binding protein [Acinetobacter sp. ANC 4558]OTG87471.1 hypothetical protein B9T31_02915 [Acinetobacter sp. ANC 4558]